MIVENSSAVLFTAVITQPVRFRRAYVRGAGDSRPLFTYAADDHTFTKEDAAEIAVRKRLHGMKGRKGWASRTTNTSGYFDKKNLCRMRRYEADVEGWLDETGQGVIQHDGRLLVTNNASVLLFGGSRCGECADDPATGIKHRFETSSLMGCRVLRVHTAH